MYLREGTRVPAVVPLVRSRSRTILGPILTFRVDSHDRRSDGDVHLNAAPVTTVNAARTTAVDIVRPQELPAVGPASLLRDTLLRTS